MLRLIFSYKLNACGSVEVTSGMKKVRFKWEAKLKLTIMISDILTKRCLYTHYYRKNCAEWSHPPLACIHFLYGFQCCSVPCSSSEVCSSLSPLLCFNLFPPVTSEIVQQLLNCKIKEKKILYWKDVTFNCSTCLSPKRPVIRTVSFH